MKTLTAGQKAYREFLKTEFWKNLSSEKKRLVSACEECGSTRKLQAHHTSYPKDWFDSTLDHLKTLCGRCHRRAHGLFQSQLKCTIFPYRSDERFNRFIHWTDYLRGRIIAKWKPLKKREVLYLRLAIKAYPPSEKDGCMAFHVNHTLRDHKFISVN